MQMLLASASTCTQRIPPRKANGMRTTPFSEGGPSSLKSWPLFQGSGKTQHELLLVLPCRQCCNQGSMRGFCSAAIESVVNLCTCEILPAEQGIPVYLAHLYRPEEGPLQESIDTVHSTQTSFLHIRSSLVRHNSPATRGEVTTLFAACTSIA